MNVTAQVLVAAAIVLVVVGVVLARVLHQLRQLGRPEPAPALLVLQNQLDALREQVRSSLEGGRREIDRRLEETNRIVGDVRRELGEVDRQVRSVNDAARDLRGLQEMLRSPKVRGGMGELLLTELLSQVLPQAHYDVQYEFAGGERVDAVIRLGDGLVPVDAKFPLDNFRRMWQADGNDADGRLAQRGFRADVRRHVDAIAKRYIRPGEGTYDFALMYIPAEGVYQELIRQEDGDGLELLQYALTRKVVPVSPHSFYAYLQVIVLGLRGLTIESRAREIMKRLGEVRRRLDRFGESFEVVGRHLGNARSQYDEAGKRLSQLDGVVAELADESPSKPDDETDSPPRLISQA